MSMVEDQTAPILLAHEAPFRVGSPKVLPATREVCSSDGTSEVIEPRVMQVFVALFRAGGHVVSRDELTRRCWESVVVGEDSINRVMSRLRRLAERLADGSFRVETVTKVGYRLIEIAPAPEQEPAPEQASSSPSAALATVTRRRGILIGAGALGALAASWAAWRIFSHGQGRSSPSPAVAALMSQGLIASRSGTSEGINQAVAFFRRATQLEPDNADAWGALAMAHALVAFSAERGEQHAARARARNALDRARELDPTNAYAAIAMASIRSLRGNWYEVEQLLTSALEQHPDSDGLRGSLFNLLAAVGRVREAAEVCLQIDLDTAPSSMPLYRRALTLWSANRLEEADRTIEQAYQLFPLQYGIWFTRFYLLLFTGRVGQAIAMVEDADGRPLGIPESNFLDILAVARALETRQPALVDAAVRTQFDRAHTGAGHAENAVMFVSALGRVDVAFAILDAYYFERGFVVPDIRFPGQQRFRTRLEDRHTAILFTPPLAQLRRDPRFDRLTEELGLKRYWRQSGHPMDPHLR